MEIAPILEFALPGDVILTGSTKIWPLYKPLIRHGQNKVTPDGKDSEWEHILMYQDSKTILESTMDFKPYLPTEGPFDNGPQRNALVTLMDCEYGVLFCWGNLISFTQRQTMIRKAAEIVDDPWSGGYDITGLFGSLLAYRMGWKSNPLSTGMYCSAFISRIINSIGLDPSENTDKNTCPEQIYQWLKKYGLKERRLGAIK